jgi:membrane associated rhomboid family serine protease
LGADLDCDVLPIPLTDENPTERAPVATVGLIVLNVLVWLYELVHGVSLSVLDYGLIPSWLLHGLRQGPLTLGDGTPLVLIQEVPWPLTVLSAMFVHASWMHLIGNMWFLWIFGDNVEDFLGRRAYLVFYLACGVAAAAAQILSGPGSNVPVVGASGAIAGVLGGYALLYPRARVRCLLWVIIFVTFVRIPAWVLLGGWFILQFFTPGGSGVAWVAHVGGFLAGLALVWAFGGRDRARTSRVSLN